MQDIINLGLLVDLLGGADRGRGLSPAAAHKSGLCAFSLAITFCTLLPNLWLGPVDYNTHESLSTNKCAGKNFDK